MEIRKATTEDIPAIIKIARITWPVAYKNILSEEQLKYMLDKFYDPEELKSQIETGQYFILALDENNVIAGFASFGKSEDTPGTFHLHKLYVLPEFQKLHAGRMLLDYAIEETSRLGVQEINLNVNRFNTARYFYEKLGFKIVRKVDNPIGNGYFMNDFIMTKKLV